MNWAGAEIPEDVVTLQALVRHQREQLAERDARLAHRDGTIERLREHINVLLAKRYGASAETVAEAQLGLFNEAELEAHTGGETEEPGTEVATHRRGRPRRKPLPAELPRVDVAHPLAESERVCPHHGVELERFDEVISEQLDIIPATVQVLRHIRGKYRCPCCEGHIRTCPSSLFIGTVRARDEKPLASARLAW